MSSIPNNDLLCIAGMFASSSPDIGTVRYGQKENDVAMFIYKQIVTLLHLLT